MALLRIDRILSDMGVASRKELKEMIRNGRVSVDGQTVRKPEDKCDPESTVICIDGEPLRYSKFLYFMMDKPCGIVTATEDKKQDTVVSLLSAELQRMGIFPVGRLDKDTSGLLLLTNDGDFAHRVISPKSEIEKRYIAEVDGRPDEVDVRAFAEGIELRDGFRCLPAKLELLGGGSCAVTVMEGKYHQVRRMLASRGKPVLQLRRVSIGNLTIDSSLGEGGYRELTTEELKLIDKNI